MNTVMKSTVQQLVTEVRALVQQAMEADKVEQTTLDGAMIHMIANFDAEDYFAQLQPKEFAEFLKQGIPPVDNDQVILYIGGQHEMIIDQLDEEECLVWWSLFMKRVENFWWL